MDTIKTALDLRWTLLIAVASIVATAVLLQGASTAGHLVAERTPTLDGQLWRLVTGPLVHATWGHLLRDLALLIFVGVIFEGELGWRWPIACAAGLIVPTLACFIADSNLAGFYGTSGLTHTVLAAALAHVLVRGPTTDRWIRWAAITGAVLLAGKVSYEVIADAPLFHMDLGSGVRQLPVAHFAGAIVGTAIALIPAGSGSGRA